MKYLQILKDKFNQDQLLVLFSCFVLTFPFYISGPIYVIEALYLLYTKKGIDAFKNTPKIKYLYLFLGLSLIVSVISKNLIGVGCVVAIAIFIMLMLYYREHITPELFELIVDLLIFLSIFWAIYGLYEQTVILHRLGYSHFTLKIFSRRENRLNSVFFNANYYAMMIEFLIMMITYKFFTTKHNIKKSIYYVCVGLLNVFMLYMTGCRTALIAIAGAMIIFLIINKNYKLCTLIGVGFIAIVAFFFIHPDKFPRIEYLLSNYAVRIKIWKAAIQGIKAHPLFGQGPMTYMMIFKQYGGHATQHAHSVYLDPILSFGIVGIGLLVPYVIDNFKRLFIVVKQNLNRSYFALVISCIVVILLHGTLDYTIFWLHTGLLFLFIANSFAMYPQTH